VRVSITSDAGELAAELDGVGDRLPATIRPVVARASLNIKNDARARIGRSPHIPMYASTITYDTEETVTSVTAEIGPDKDKTVGGGPFRTPGNLGNILEYGTGDTAPIPHLGPALDAEEPRFVRALEDAIAEAIDG
jgi:hypothetical protein